MKEVTVRHTSLLKRVPAMLGATVMVTAALAGCALIPGYGDCDPEYESGDASSLVTAEGSFGVTPTVDFPTPLVVTKPEVSVIDAGDGAQIRSGDQVEYAFAEFLGGTGEALSGDGAQARIASGVDGDAVSAALVCARVGDRLAVTATAKQAQDDTVDEGETVVFVIDVIASYLGKADGFNQLPKDGMPTVVTAVDGTPGITVPAQDPPTQTVSSVIKAGDGVAVKTDDTLVIHYTFWTWPSTVGGEPEQIDSSWAGHSAANLPLTANLPSRGLLNGLLGQKVGSQILVVIPPGDDSFPAGQGPAGDDATYIFVVDILGIQK